jgi:hypothetical protein
MRQGNRTFDFILLIKEALGFLAGPVYHIDTYTSGGVVV